MKTSETWQARFCKKMQGDCDPVLLDGQILAREPWIFNWSYEGEEAWQETVLEAFFKERLSAGEWEPRFSFIDDEDLYDDAAGEFASEFPLRRLGRDGLHDPAWIDAMLARGGEALQDGLLSTLDLLSPKFPLSSPGDAILDAGYRLSGAKALDQNRGVMAFNLLADYSNALPEEARREFLASADPRRVADEIKYDLENECCGSISDWAGRWRMEIRAICGLEPGGWEEA